MDALAQKKIAEAKQHITDAEKSMKTSLFKRKPDLESAANSYSQAGSCFRVAKEFKQAIESCKKAAECFAQNNALFSAAKQYEQIALMANEIKNYSLVYESIQKAGEYMITSGTRDSAGGLLERGANMLKLTDPEKSLLLYKRAFQIAEVEEKYHEMVNYTENMISLALRSNQYNDAISSINDSYSVLDRVGSPEQYVKYIVTAMLVYLSRDDWVGAKAYLDKMKEKYDIANSSRMDELLEAYDEKDDAKFKDLTKGYLSHVVDNEALKIAQKIVKSDEWIKAQQVQKPKPNPVATPSYQLPPVQKVDNFRQDEQPVIKKCDSNAKYNEYDLEPDGCKVHQDDHHQKDKQAHEIDDEEPFVNEDVEPNNVEINFEPDGSENPNEDHYQKDKHEHQKAEDEDEFADGIL